MLLCTCILVYYDRIVIKILFFLNDHPVQKKTVGGPPRLPCSPFGFEVRSGRGSQAFCGRIEEYATIRNAVRIRYGKTQIRYGKWKYAMPNANTLW